MTRFICGDEAAMPYSDRKLMRSEEGGLPLPLGMKVLIQQLDCKGLSRDQIVTALDDPSRELIYDALHPEKRENIDAMLADSHFLRVSMEQIARVLDPVDESADVSRRRRPVRANVGHAQMKQRFR